MTLDMMETGGVGVVREILDAALRRRLWALGIFPGATVRASYRAPAGDPRTYEFASACVALRKKDAGSVVLWD